MKHTYTLLLAALILVACQPPADTPAPEASDAIEPADTAADTAVPEPSTPTTAPPTPTDAPAEPTATPAPGETEIVIDGQVDDWEGRPLIADDGIDVEGGYLDITQVYAFANMDALYLRLDVADPAAPLEQIDLGIQAGGQGFILSHVPGSQEGYLANVGPTTETTFGYGSSLEIRVDRAEFGDPAEISLYRVNVMVGECCDPSTWLTADNVEGFGDTPVVYEVDAGTLAEGMAEAATSRPHHVYLPDGSPAAYLHRAFIQVPVGMARGPDGLVYIADWLGRHIVRMSPDGSAEELGIWQANPGLWQMDSPHDLAFDSTGTLYALDHSHIYRIDADNTVEALPDATGSLWRWTPDEGPSLITDGIPWAEDVVVGLDGTVYVSQMQQDRVVKVDPGTGAVTVFASGGLGYTDPIFMTLDAEGDLWIRGIFTLRQFAPDGSEKPYTIDGSPPTFNWHTSAGLAFDGEGRLWVASYGSWVARLDPTSGADDYTLTIPVPGWESSDLAIDSSGGVIAVNDDTEEVWRYTLDGEGELLTQLDGPGGRVSVAVDREGTIFLGLPWNGVVYLDANGEPVHYADVLTRRMVFGADGLLYAVQEGADQRMSIVRISGPDSVETVTTTLGGSTITGEVHLSPAPDGGLYAFSEETRILYTLSPDGQSEVFLDLAELGGSGPAVMAASPTGEVFVIMHGPYALVRISPDGQMQDYVYGIYGDPWGMVVSPDGEWLYIAENGALDAIPTAYP